MLVGVLVAGASYYAALFGFVVIVFSDYCDTCGDEDPSFELDYALTGAALGAASAVGMVLAYLLIFGGWDAIARARAKPVARYGFWALVVGLPGAAAFLWVIAEIDASDDNGLVSVLLIIYVVAWTCVGLAVGTWLSRRRPRSQRPT